MPLNSDRRAMRALYSRRTATPEFFTAATQLLRHENLRGSSPATGDPGTTIRATARNFVTSLEPLVSVIVPTYNRTALLARAIRSVQSQTYTNFELLVVDDASTDETLDMLHELDEPRLEILRHEINRGAGAARNTGIDAASGDFIALLDSDDRWLPAKLERNVVYAGSVDDESIFYSQTVIVRGRGSSTVPARAIRPSECVLSYVLRDGFIQTSSLFGPRRIFAEVRFPEDEQGPLDDWDFMIRAHHSGVAFSFIPEVLVEHHAGRHERLTTATSSFSAEEWLQDHAKWMSHDAKRSFKGSWVALEHAGNGRTREALAAVSKGLLGRAISVRSAGGVLRAVLARD